MLKKIVMVVLVLALVVGFSMSFSSNAYAADGKDKPKTKVCDPNSKCKAKDPNAPKHPKANKGQEKK